MSRHKAWHIEWWSRTTPLVLSSRDLSEERGKLDYSQLSMTEFANFGNSASAPTFAAIISLLNTARLKAKKKPLGFLNPWLYSDAKAGLVDITLGGSTGCTGTDIYSGLSAPYVPYASWNATTGWDPVTGLGTPNFKKLLEISSGKCAKGSC